MEFIEVSILEELFPDKNPEEIQLSLINTIQEYCNTTFELKTREGFYDSTFEVYLECRPIHLVSSIKDNGITLIENHDFYVYKNKIVLNKPSKKRKGLNISYKSGFEEIPETIKAVALDLARFRAFNLYEKIGFYKAQQTEERNFEYDQDIDEPALLSRLSQWVQPIINDVSQVKGPIRLGVM